MAPAWTGDEKLTVEEVERLGASIGEAAQPLVAGTPTEGNRRQGEVFERGTRHQREVPDDPIISGQYWQRVIGITLVLSEYSLGRLSYPYLSPFCPRERPEAVPRRRATPGS
jgi:hypothetical protein